MRHIPSCLILSLLCLGCGSSNTSNQKKEVTRNEISFATTLISDSVNLWWARDFKDIDGDRILDIAWSQQRHDEDRHIGRLHIILLNKVGSLANLTTLIGKSGGNITNLKIINRAEEFFDIIVDVEVQDSQHLNTIIATMRSTSVVSSVERSRG